MSGQNVALPVSVEVVPESCRTLLRPQGQLKRGEDSSAAQVNFRDVKQPGGYSVARSQAFKGTSLLPLETTAHTNVTKQVTDPFANLQIPTYYMQ